MVPGFLQGLNKRKTPIVELHEDRDRNVREVMLELTICYAQDIDRDTKDAYGDKRIYCIYVWLDDQVGFWTRVEEGLPNPVWNRSYSVPLPLGKCPKYDSLYLEIYRVNSLSDPGTSNGDVLVGRTRIALPNGVHRKKSGRYGLVLPTETGCSAEGYITLAIEMRRYYT